MTLPAIGGSLSGRVVLVTGASAGNGRAAALALSAAGASVVGMARSGDRLAQVDGVVPLVGDVTVAADRQRAIDTVVAEHGRLDVLVNNAGIGAVGVLTDLTSEQLERLYATNVLAVADLTRLALPHLRAVPQGDVVMMSSVGAWASVPPLTAYCSTKFAVDGLVEGLRRELWRSSVRVHSINPGPVATEWLSRASGWSPGEGEARPSPGVSPDRVGAAVLKAVLAGHPRTLAVPRVLGMARLAQVPPMGALLDIALGLAGRRLTDVGQRMTAARSAPAPK